MIQFNQPCTVDVEFETEYYQFDVTIDGDNNEDLKSTRFQNTLKDIYNLFECLPNTSTDQNTLQVRITVRPK